MKNFNNKIEAVVIIIIFLFCMASIPISIANNESKSLISLDLKNNTLGLSNNENQGMLYDTFFVEEQENLLLIDEQNDIGYNTDAGNNILKAMGFPVYIGEPIDEIIPGRGRTGFLNPEGNDPEDWYSFSVCEGQNIQSSIISNQDYGFEIYDIEGNPKGESITADITGIYLFRIYANEGAESGDYTFSLTLNGQNDAGTGGDAGNDIGSSTSINPGTYSGYMSYYDQEDWYSFNSNSGEGIFINIDTIELSDYDLHLYNPSGELVHSAQFYGPDELEYPADASGTWKIKIDMFPGWDTSKWPENYFLYGSGAYTFELSIGGSAESPPNVIPQPEIKPIAQTYIINDNPDSNKDEYGYISAIPATNYIENEVRYVSPIIYQGINDITNWFGTVDDTTQYLIDDWNTYLERHDMVAEEYILPDDPIEAASEIAAMNWESSDTAVLVCDGSDFLDEIETVIEGDYSLSSSPNMERYYPGDFKDFEGTPAVPMFIGSKWGAIHMIALGDNYAGDTALITPRYERVKDDNWPHPYDVDGPDYDTWYPIIKPGIWIPLITSESNLEELQIIKYPGDRYNIPIETTDCSIEVNIETDSPSTLLAILVDPDGTPRRPHVPNWNGGEIRPIHYWNGGHWEHNFDDYRYWIVEPHDDLSFELHHPMIGDWTLIIVPYFNHPELSGNFNSNYHLSANIRKYNPDRINSALSAANGAVIASMNHFPLLYVKSDSIPSVTTETLSLLNTNNIIFVNIGGVSSASPTGSVIQYSSLQEVINKIKENSDSENFITITSLGSGDGYFAPSAMIAAYHIAPVLNIGEAAEAYDTNDKIASWREWTTDPYHGCNAPGHLPAMNEPSELLFPPSIIDLLIYYLNHNQELPPTGLDMKLQWFSTVNDGIENLISNYGLDYDGKEAYLFVAPRITDIRHTICRAMIGNNSYAGMIPVETTGFSTAVICRNILYPALMFANEGRDIITSCFMNYRNGHTWRCNDGQQYTDFITQILKECGYSHGRFFEGHSLWSNILDRYNKGSALIYHCSHGTGGSGICCMYENIAEQFPLAEPRYDHLKNFNWWDGWRGYLFDNPQTPTPRNGGLVWFNAQEPNLYDIIHFKWCDQLFENLHSNFVIWQSCSTGEQFGPIIYLEHGAALVTANAGSGRSPQSEIQDQWTMQDMLIDGKGIGESMAEEYWLMDADYTTCDPTTLYGASHTSGLTNCRVVYGDPTMTCFSPEWIEPTPILP